MNKKVTVIGAGAVGSTIGYLLAAKELASEVVFVDVNKAKAEGEALDIYQATPFLSPCKVTSGEYEDAKGSDIVIITSGVARKPGQSRIDLAQINVNIIKSIAKPIAEACPNAIYIIVANPVDVLTYAFHQVSGIPANRIIGSGTSLDTARLRSKLAEIFNINPMQVDANVFGEHGDTSFVPWSLVRIGGVNIDEYAKKVGVNDVKPYDKDEVVDFVRKSGGIIIANKGATFYGVAAAVVDIVNAIYNGANNVICVSCLLKGEYGIEDVCVSIPAIINREGIKATITPALTNEEQEKLVISANAMKSVIDQVNCK